MQTPPPLCDFEQWIDTENKPEDKEWMQKLLRWEAENKKMMKKRRGEKAAKKEHKKEEERRCIVAYRRRGRRSLSVHAERKQPRESSDGGKSRCLEEGKVVSLHLVVSMTC